MCQHYWKGWIKQWTRVSWWQNPNTQFLVQPSSPGKVRDWWGKALAQAQKQWQTSSWIQQCHGKRASQSEGKQTREDAVEWGKYGENQEKARRLVLLHQQGAAHTPSSRQARPWLNSSGSQTRVNTGLKCGTFSNPLSLSGDALSCSHRHPTCRPSSCNADYSSKERGKKFHQLLRNH